MHRASHPFVAWVRTLWCVLLLAGGIGAYAVQGASTSIPDIEPTTLFGQFLTPLYLEKTVNPFAAKQDTGWQVSGFNTNFASNSLGGGALKLTGGLYYSQRIDAQATLKANTSSMARFGADTSAETSLRSLGIGRMFGSRNDSTQGVADQITLQAVEYQAGGLRLAGKYADVGKDFQGLDVLAKQMSQSDPTGAKLLRLGVRHTEYSLGYTGIKGLNIASSQVSDENTLAGQAENGLTRSTQTNSLGVALGAKHSLNYTVTNLVESWDSTVAKKDTREVQTQAFKLAGALGKKSQFSLGETVTSTTLGLTQTDVKQQSLSLNWADWQRLGFSGSYVSSLTEQTGVQNDILKLNLNSTLSAKMKLTGTLEDNGTWDPNTRTMTAKDFLNLKLETALTPRLSLVNQQTTDSRNPNVGETDTLSHKLSWQVSPKWRLNAELVDSENSKVGESDKVEMGITGQFGNTKAPQQIGLLNRHEELPNQVVQERQEVTYTIPLGAKQAKLQANAGMYALTTANDGKAEEMLAVQMLSWHPGKRTTVSLGYFEGPRLGTSFMAYRNDWGLRYGGNLGVWSPADFTHYQEWGGQVEQKLTDRTTVLIRHFQGDIEDTGAQSTREFGVKHQFGAASIMAGRRYTEQPGKSAQTVQEESWWKLTLPFAGALPAWAINSTRMTVFDDGTIWGINRLPEWLAKQDKPVNGLTISRSNVLFAGKPVDDYHLRMARMVGSRFFMQASYERNPRKLTNLNEIDQVHRGMLHLAYAPKDGLQFFCRFINEARQDTADTLLTRSFGFIGRFSATQRLQIQADALTRTGKAISTSGIAFMGEYERTLNPDDSLLLKCRVTPITFAAPGERVQLEGSYRHTF
ncbi:MAG: hypothetical protein ACYDBB_15775 [Armatimonadota bacterium]